MSWGDAIHPTGWDFDRTVFVAIVPTVGVDKYPADIGLSQAVFHYVFSAPYNDANYVPYDTVIPTHFVLQPGDYAIVFGSGLFGATGGAYMSETYTGYDPTVFFMYQAHMSSYFISETGTANYRLRFLVYGESCAASPSVCVPDTDGDEIADTEDSCPSSNLTATVVIGGCHQICCNRIFAPSLPMKGVLP